MQGPADLPAPSPDALAHSRQVVELVRARIADAGGWIGFADYMNLVLYAPGLGYYSAGARKFGPDGDFVTAPEMGSLFARVLARVCASTLASLGAGTLVEVGAGSGALAADLLGCLAATPPERYLIVEVSADLRERQRSLLAARVPALLDRVCWLDRLPAEPVEGVVLANEVLDALPVERFRVADGVVESLGVTLADHGLAWAAAPAPATAPLARAVRALEAKLGQPFPQPYVSELRLGQAAWLASIAERVRRGVLLLVDYGGTRREVYHPERRDGTLVCHYRHRAHGDPFLHPGLQDLTAWVDFSALAEAAAAAGLDVAGYGTQAHFLLGSGVLDALAAGPMDGVAGARAAAEARQLLMPGEMGERFKVMLLTRGEVSLPPLLARDLRPSL